MALNISYAMWGALFAWILLHAPPTLLALTGCVVVSAGAVLTILSGREPRPPKRQAATSRPPRRDGQARPLHDARATRSGVYSLVSSRRASSGGISITAVKAARSSACRVVWTTRTLHIAWVTTSPGTEPSI